MRALTRSLAAARKQMKTELVIIGSGPAAHTAAIYAGRAAMQPIMFEGFETAATEPAGMQGESCRMC